MNPRQLEIFSKVVEHGSITAAATVSHLTQSAVSRLIQRLEEDVGFNLFVRKKGRLAVTEEGKALYREISRVFTSLTDIEHAAQRIRTVGTGTLRLCVMPSLQQGFMPETIALFKKRYANISIFLDVQNYHEVMQTVLHGRAELGFATLPIEDAYLNSTVIARTSLVCLLPSTHPLATKSVIHVSDLDKVDYIKVPRARYGDQLEYFFSRHGVRPHTNIEARTVLAAAALAVSGVGICIADPFSLTAAMDPRVSVRPLVPKLEVAMGALYRSRESLSSLENAFLELCIERAKETLNKFPMLMNYSGPQSQDNIESMLRG